MQAKKETELQPGLREKYAALQSLLKTCKTVAIAFSGGVDSTFLLKTAHDTLGENAIAITAETILVPSRELNQAAAFCEQEGIARYALPPEDLSIADIAHNPPNRCYLCKRSLFTRILALAREKGMSCVAEGSNVDDLGDYRPGMTALRELGIRSPLQEAGLTKEEIRTLSREMGLPTWNKPSMACLASRFAYGETITPERLQMVDRAEQLLLARGFRQYRVRIHSGGLARIEVEQTELERLLSYREELVSALKKMGFRYVTMDLSGFRSGSMNEVLETKEI